METPPLHKKLSTADLEGFSGHIFWDTSLVNILALENPYPFLVERVLDYGLLSDWFHLKRLIGLSEIAKVAKSLKGLDPKSARLLSVVAEEPIENFACYTSTPSTLNFWNS